MKLYGPRNIKNCFIVFSFLFYSLIFCEQDQESHFNTHTDFYENGEKTVTYEHCGSNDQGDFAFSATFEHTKYDTCEMVSCSDFTFNHQLHDDSSAQSDDNTVDFSSTTQSPEQDTLFNNSSDPNDYHNQDDQYDFNEIFNKQNEDKFSTHSQQDSEDYQYAKQRSFIYLWCKAIKDRTSATNLKDSI